VSREYSPTRVFGLVRNVGLTCLLLTACTPATPPGPSPTVLYGPADVYGAAWVENLGIVFNDGDEPNGNGTETRLWAIDPAGGQPNKLIDIVDTTPACWRQEELRPSRLRDGRLGYIRDCNGEAGYPLTWAALAYDPTSRSVAELFAVDDLLRYFSWDGQGRSYFSIGAGICGAVGIADAAGVRSLDGQLERNGQTFDFGRAWHDETTQPDCPDAGRADFPALSADGTTLAVMVSFATTPGMARLDEPWDIYLRDVASGEMRFLAGGFVGPTDLAWSPSADALTIAAQAAGESTGALWSVDAASGQLTKLLASPVSQFAWSPDGSSLAAVVDVADERFHRPGAMVIVPTPVAP
jgi:hypothetical protein